VTTLLRVHVVLIASTIALCLAYLAWELSRSDVHGTVRTAIGVGVPLVVAAALGLYLRHVVRKAA